MVVARMKTVAVWMRYFQRGHNAVRPLFSEQTGLGCLSGTIMILTMELFIIPPRTPLLTSWKWNCSGCSAIAYRKANSTEIDQRKNDVSNNSTNKKKLSKKRHSLRKRDMDKLLEYLKNNENITNSIKEEEEQLNDVLSSDGTLLGRYRHIQEGSWRSFVKELCKKGDFEGVRRILRWRRKGGFCTSSDLLYSFTIHLLSKQCRAEEAESLFQEMKMDGNRACLKAYNALLKGYLRAGLMQKAEAMFSEMEEEGINPDRTTFRLLINAYMTTPRRVCRKSIQRVLKKVENCKDKQGISTVLVSVLSRFRDRGKWQKVFVLMKQMKAARFPLNVPICNVMIDTFGKFNHLQHSVNVFEKMMKQGLQPTEITWNTLIDCHCRAGQHAQAMDLFGQMRQRGFSPTIHTYNIIFKSLGEEGKLDSIPDLLSQMKENGLLPDIVTYTTIIDAYGRAGEWYQAYQTLQLVNREDVKPSSGVYCALVNAYAQEGMYEPASNIFQMMLGGGVEPDLIIFNSLLNASSVSGKYLEALSIFDYMKERNIKPDVVTYTTLMKALVKSQRYVEVPNVYKEMCLSGCVPDRKAKDMLSLSLKYIKRSSNQGEGTTVIEQSNTSSHISSL
eukprot:TRINITY_DN1850_c0_g1_i4.p1 TRINITY_DN1850_c0_g1~~TRINITY_DN1850_c0_g1_i4.p1  ORF type:complete len:616 (-),score=106.24 TRINITY_DN1850_c0_g1_i4:409-2256(-)